MKHHPFPVLPLLLLQSLLLLRQPLGAAAFTVIVPDEQSSSKTLVDTPQSGFSGARTDPAEQQAVYDIMRATGNPWAASIPDVCHPRWHGIECMPDNHGVFHVVSLSFGALSDDTAFPACNHTSSFLSPALTRLPHIRTLFFYQCFSANPQPIPPFLARLAPSLHTLVLRDNALVGPIPPDLGNLTLLRVLDLHSNNLSSSIPTSLLRLASLRSLDLSANRLTGSIPPLPTAALDVLDLSNNLLRGPIPSSLANCRALIKMDLSRNSLAGPIPPDLFHGLQSLMLLDLSYNRLSGPLPSSLRSLTSLEALILKANPMQSALIPDDIFSPSLKNLMIVILSDMGLRGSIPDSLGRLPSLRVLQLDRNGLNGSIPESFKHSTGLSELKVNNNGLVGPIPFGREMLWRMGRKLVLSNNSGLCYDGCSSGGGGGGAEEGVDSLSFVAGIGCCQTKAGPVVGVATKTTQHVSARDHRLEPGPIRPANSVGPGTPGSMLILTWTLAAAAHLFL
ncbi:hypothetical protein ACLOJK_027745 [Asimina triloba]